MPEKVNFDMDKGIRVVNAKINDQILKNLLAQSEYIGEGLVEEFVPPDADFLNKIYKSIGSDFDSL